MNKTYRPAFDRLRKNYRPRKTRLLMIAESPPSSGGFFYFPVTIGKDHLFRETMKALELWPRDKPMRRGVDKRLLLRQFQAMGFYLLDACSFPVDRLNEKKRTVAVQSELARLVRDVRSVNPLHIVIVKSSIFKPVSMALKQSGLEYRILNRARIPFPSHGNQRLYRMKLRRVLRETPLFRLPAG